MVETVSDLLCILGAFDGALDGHVTSGNDAIHEPYYEGGGVLADSLFLSLPINLSIYRSFYLPSNPNAHSCADSSWTLTLPLARILTSNTRAFLLRLEFSCRRAFCAASPQEQHEPLGVCWYERGLRLLAHHDGDDACRPEKARYDDVSVEAEWPHGVF